LGFNDNKLIIVINAVPQVKLCFSSVNFCMHLLLFALLSIFLSLTDSFAVVEELLPLEMGFNSFGFQRENQKDKSRDFD
jgi:hypothetical protein